jgi:hypothetical protein
LRIGFDVDGVVADMQSELVRHAGALFGEAIVEAAQRPPAAASRDAARDADDGSGGDVGPPAITLNITPRQEGKLWRHVRSIENFWESLREIEPGIIARLAALAEERRWEIIFLTKRPDTAGATPQLQTQRWLQAMGFPLPSVYVVQGNRGRIAAALSLDIVVDDRPENCLDVAVDSKARAILVWRDDPNNLPTTARRLGIGVVRSVGECLDVLTQADAAGETGLITRIMRALGLKQPVESV